VISKPWLILAFVDYYFDDFKYTTILNVKNINMDINIQLAVNPESLPHTKRPDFNNVLSEIHDIQAIFDFLVTHANVTLRYGLC
jgi:hypothetical protein